jgi:hypothetical protein
LIKWNRSFHPYERFSRSHRCMLFFLPIQYASFILWLRFLCVSWEWLGIKSWEASRRRKEISVNPNANIERLAAELFSPHQINKELAHGAWNLLNILCIFYNVFPPHRKTLLALSSSSIEIHRIISWFLLTTLLLASFCSLKVNRRLRGVNNEK